jgi:ABC-type proline/glycine betaine transport system permease subunit
VKKLIAATMVVGAVGGVVLAVLFDEFLRLVEEADNRSREHDYYYGTEDQVAAFDAAAD